MTEKPEHKQGCDALGGYGQGVGPCSCGAAGLSVVPELPEVAWQDGDFVQSERPVDLCSGDASAWIPLTPHAPAQATINELRAEVARLTRERDAAFAMSRCECSPDEACANVAALRAEVARLQSEVTRLVGSWTSAVSNYGIQKRERERVEGEVRKFEARIHGQRMEITRLSAELAALKAKQAADIDETMRLASDFATVYGRLHFARQCGGPITKVGEETEAARETLRSALAASTPQGQEKTR